MIRVVEFEYFSDGRVDSVAFVDTVNDTFVRIGDDQFWHTLDDLMESVSCCNEPPEKEFIGRLIGLSPAWFVDNHEAWRLGSGD